MKIIYNIIKCLCTAVFPAVLLAGCSDWTRPESVDFHYTTLEEKNPALYEAYYESIREYRESEHKIVIAKFENKAAAPAGKGEHINALPDSVDFIILQNASVLSGTIKAEMQEVRELKGQKILYQINYKSIEDAWKAYREQWIAEHPEVPEETATDDNTEENTDESENPDGPETPGETMLTLNEYVANEMKVQTAYLKEYGYDGLNLVYSVRNPASFTEEQLAEAIVAQEAVLTPVVELLDANPDALFFLEGTPQHIRACMELVGKADYFLLPTTSAVNNDELSYIMMQTAMYNNIPNDRFIACTTTRSFEEPDAKPGTFTGGITAIAGAAGWVTMPTDGYVKAGISVANAQNDYYNVTKVYSNIRQAISTMNPSPLK